MDTSQSKSTLARIDSYVEELFSPTDEALQAALDESTKNGLPAINVSANEGKLLYMLARMCGARRILEIGTLGGYSTIWLARALPPDGSLLSLEYSAKHAEVARANIERAGLSGKVEVRVGAGLDLLPAIAEKGEGPFDLFFIDADKVNYPGYLQWCLKLARPGSIILADNLLRDGAVIDPSHDDESAVGAAEYNRLVAANQNLESIIIPVIRDTSGVVDGLGISIVVG